jgi:hypothetical protein
VPPILFKRKFNRETLNFPTKVKEKTNKLKVTHSYFVQLEQPIIFLLNKLLKLQNYIFKIGLKKKYVKFWNIKNDKHSSKKKNCSSSAAYNIVRKII